MGEPCQCMPEAYRIGPRLRILMCGNPDEPLTGLELGESGSPAAAAAAPPAPSPTHSYDWARAFHLLPHRITKADRLHIAGRREDNLSLPGTVREYILQQKI